MVSGANVGLFRLKAWKMPKVDGKSRKSSQGRCEFGRNKILDRIARLDFLVFFNRLLESLSSQFAQESFGRGIDWLRLASVRACEIALSKSGLDEPTVAAALDLLRSGSGVVAAAGIQTIAHELDERYFDLNELDDAASRSAALDAFSRARAASAVAFAAKGDAQSILECIYEAAMTFDDPHAFIDMLSTRLSRQTSAVRCLSNASKREPDFDLDFKFSG